MNIYQVSMNRSEILSQEAKSIIWALSRFWLISFVFSSVIHASDTQRAMVQRASTIQLAQQTMQGVQNQIAAILPMVPEVSQYISLQQALASISHIRGLLAASAQILSVSNQNLPQQTLNRILNLIERVSSLLNVLSAVPQVQLLKEKLTEAQAFITIICDMPVGSNDCSRMQFSRPQSHCLQGVGLPQVATPFSQLVAGGGSSFQQPLCRQSMAIQSPVIPARAAISAASSTDLSFSDDGSLFSCAGTKQEGMPFPALQSLSMPTVPLVQQGVPSESSYSTPIQQPSSEMMADVSPMREQASPSLVAFLAEKVQQGTHYRCEVCRQRFTRRVRLQEHSSTQHGGKAEDHLCGYCERLFPVGDWKVFAGHLHNVHPERLWVCDLCPARFTDYRTLRTHGKRVHSLSVAGNRKRRHAIASSPRAVPEEISVLPASSSHEGVFFDEAVQDNTEVSASGTSLQLDFAETGQEEACLPVAAGLDVSSSASSPGSRKRKRVTKSVKVSRQPQAFLSAEQPVTAPDSSVWQLPTVALDQQDVFLDSSFSILAQQPPSESAADVLVPMQEKAASSIVASLARKKQKEGDYRCEVCANCFTRKNSLQRHFQTKHAERESMTTHLCGHCNESFSADCKGVFLEHLRTRHSGVLPGRVCLQQKSEKGRYYRCKQCYRTFVDKAHLKGHIHRDHQDGGSLQEYLCNYCDQIFKIEAVKGTFLDHLRKKHLDMLFACKVCTQGFDTRFRLKRHERVHNQGRPYKCSLCTYAANQSYLLRKHLKETHSCDTSSGWMKRYSIVLSD